MEELIVGLIENGVALAAFGFAWKQAEMRYKHERTVNEKLQDRFISQLERIVLSEEKNR